MRSSTLSLNLSVIGPSNSGETRSKVDPHGKGLRVGTDFMEF